MEPEEKLQEQEAIEEPVRNLLNELSELGGENLDLELTF